MAVVGLGGATTPSSRTSTAPWRPSWSHGLGRDELGRDILSRILYGARISLGMALGASIIAAGAGVIWASPPAGAEPRREILMRGWTSSSRSPLPARHRRGERGARRRNLMVASASTPSRLRAGAPARARYQGTEHVAAARLATAGRASCGGTSCLTASPPSSCSSAAHGHRDGDRLGSASSAWARAPPPVGAMLQHRARYLRTAPSRWSPGSPSSSSSSPGTSWATGSPKP
jgi:hypothetical protein